LFVSPDKNDGGRLEHSNVSLSHLKKRSGLLHHSHPGRRIAEIARAAALIIFSPRKQMRGKMRESLGIIGIIFLENPRNRSCLLTSMGGGEGDPHGFSESEDSLHIVPLGRIFIIWGGGGGVEKTATREVYTFTRSGVGGQNKKLTANFNFPFICKGRRWSTIHDCGAFHI